MIKCCRVGETIIAGCLLILVNLQGAFAAQDPAGISSYSYQNIAYATLGEAEAAMRATFPSGVRNNLVRHLDASNGSATSTVRYAYSAPTIDAYPVSDWGYGANPSSGSCIPPPGLTGGCATEAEALSLMTNWYYSNCGSPSTAFGDGFILNTWISSGDFPPNSVGPLYKENVTVNYQRQELAADKITWLCVSHTATGTANKTQAYGCPIGYLTDYQYDSSAPGGVSKAICTNSTVAYIYATVTQYCGENVNNPCDAATGEKAQTEVDYASPTLSFFRQYHSARIIDQRYEMAPGWQHNYNQYLIMGGGSPFYAVRPGGYIVPLRADVSGAYFGTVGSFLQTTQTGAGWLLINNRGEHEYYDNNGRLLWLEDRPGNRTQLTYNGDQLTTVVGPQGQTIRFTYDVNSGRLISVQDPSGNSFQYTYDAVGNLAQVIYPDGKNRQYHYEDVRFPTFLTGITDENGVRYATYAYDDFGHAILTEHAGGALRATLTYNADNTTTVTNALGAVRTYHFTKLQGIRKATAIDGGVCDTCGSSHVAARTYDGYGYIASSTDFNGGVTTYVRDASGLELKRTEAFGTTNARTISTEWHATFRLPTRIAEPLKLTTYTHDANGNVLTKTEQATTDTNGSLGFGATLVGSPRVSTYTYNSFGQVLTVNGPRTDVSDVTTYTYDAQGNLSTITNAAGQVTQITSYDASGRPLRLVDPNGLVTQLTYTPRGWTSQIKVGTDTVYETTVLDYDGVGQLIKVTLPDSSFLSYSYDAAHRLTDIQDQSGNSIHYTLDLMGNRTQVDVKDPLGTLKRTHRNVYNTLSKLTQSLGADKGVNTQATYYDEYDANGNLKTLRDAQGNLTHYNYDALNRLSQVIDALNGSTSYQYNAQGQLTSVTDPRGNSTSYSYDGLGNLTQLTSPDTGVTQYTAYDTAGNLLSQTDAKGQTTSYQYDALNRLTRITYADNSSTLYQYDSGANGQGRLSSITDASGSLGYQYDLRGRVTQKTQTVGTLNLPVGYHYNAAGQLDQVTYPSGKVITYSYSNGKITQLSVNGSPLLSNINYDPFGPTTGWQLGTNAIARNYDLDGLLTSYTLGATLKQLSYASTGNLTTIQDGNAANDQSYGYDALYRLTSANGSTGSQAYSYDANGNRSSATLNTILNSYSLAANSNRLQSAQGKNYQYDNNGNIITDGLNTYSYDARNRLVGLNTGISYALNGLGQRVSKTLPGIDTSNTTAGDANGDGLINAQDYSAILNQILGAPATNNADCNQDGQVNVQDLVCINIKINPTLQPAAGKTLFTYDEQGQLIGEYTDTGTPIEETIYLGNLPVAVLKDNTVYTLYADHLNTPRAIADSTNKVVWSWNSDAFGTTAANEDPDGDGIKFSYNLRFPGQYFDQETGLHYNWNRDYDPATGRYRESDPIGLEGGLNTFAYVGGNPLKWVDLFGLKVLNPNGFPVSPDVMNALWGFNRLIGCDKDVVITGGDRSGDSKLGAGSNSSHVQHIAADIIVPGQSHLETANQADQSGLFGGVGWYEEGYRGPNGEGPHTHIDIRKNGPARWGHPKKGSAMHGYFPKYEVKLNSSNCGCDQ